MDSFEETLMHFMKINRKKKRFLPEWEIIHIINKILQGLYFLNKNGIMHRDIKPQNIVRRNKDED